MSGSKRGVRSRRLRGICTSHGNPAPMGGGGVPEVVSGIGKEEGRGWDSQRWPKTCTPRGSQGKGREGKGGVGTAGKRAHRPPANG
jgi:hypothetical protein